MEAVSDEPTLFKLPRCFELLGFDLMVDVELRLWKSDALPFSHPVHLCFPPGPVARVIFSCSSGMPFRRVTGSTTA